ncbi:MAG: DNA recombination protein RmuC [Comamonadaceae bacterium]|nr:DNA recombination protein RmuC [Burkholderiales bacterium]MEB2347351.1 DNA recombination protein RmuC [Comamonadaceae bacterium]
MPTQWIVALALLVLIALLLVVLLLRRPRVRLPGEWLARLQALEGATQATQMAVARNDGALSGMGQQLRDFTELTQGVLDERLAQAREEARASRAELQAAFGGLQARLEQLAVQARGEQTQALAAFRGELARTVQQLAADSAQSREGVAASTQGLAQRIQERFDALDLATRGTLDSLKGDIHAQLAGMSTALKDQLGLTTQELTRQLSGLVASHQQGGEALRAALNERLAAIQGDNAAKLEEMRRTVDEKLHATLEQRLGESFKLVSERLEQVHKGLGEMQTLAGSVGDLKRVMTNVKSRGTWGELQLGAIIDNVLTADQYARNVKTVPGSDELVEFAIRLPGKGDDAPVWLPVDSKYPVEHYQRLIDAQEAADKGAIASAGHAFESSIRAEAKKIHAKYVAPPHTTDFAVLYLPTEGLFAEVMRRPGLVEAVQNEARVMITGPANFAAMLSSLQMGFKTLAIEKRSSEVWGVLGQVKTEFAKFGEAVDATRKSIDAAARKFEQVDVRTRAIQRKLRNVQELPAPDAPPLTLDDE